MDEINNKCCFTGHREIPKNEIEALYRELDRTIDILIRSGVTVFKTGGARGFDTLAALTVLDKRKKDPRLFLELWLPCADQTLGWSADERATYEYIKGEADKVIVLQEKYIKGCMHQRNRCLVDGSLYCVSYCKKPTGGTAYTIDYAKKQGVRIIDLAMLLRASDIEK